MVEASAITEEIRAMLDIEVGPRTYKIEKWMLKKFADVIDDPNPLWQDEVYARKTNYRGIIASPTFVANFCKLDEQEEWFSSVKCPLTRILAGGCEIENFQPVMPGDLISVTGKLVDLQERKGKSGNLLFFTFERTYKNPKEEVVTKLRWTLIRH